MAEQVPFDLLKTVRDMQQQTYDPSTEGIEDYGNNVPVDIINQDNRDIFARVREFDDMVTRGDIVSNEDYAEAVGETNDKQDNAKAGLTPEGVWLPPEGQEAPTLNELKDNEAFMKSARAMYDASGADVAQMHSSASPTDVMTGMNQVTEVTDEMVADWAINEMTSMNWNTVSALQKVFEYKNIQDPEQARAIYNVMSMYDWASNTWGNAGKSAAYIMADPVTYTGGIVGKGVAKVAGKAMAINAIKSTMRRIASKGAAATAVREGAAIAGTEGAAVTALDDLVRQYTEKSAELRDEINPWRTAGMAGIGMITGSAIGGSLGYAAYRASGPSRQILNPESIVGETELPPVVKDTIDELVPKESLRIKEILNAEMEAHGDKSLAAETVWEIVPSKLDDKTHDRLSDAVDDYLIKYESKTLPGQREFNAGHLSTRTDKTPGTKISHLGDQWEVLGKTKNGWIRLVNKTGDVKNVRAKALEREGAQVTEMVASNPEFNSVVKVLDDHYGYIRGLINRQGARIGRSAKGEGMTGTTAYWDNVMGGKPKDPGQWTVEEAVELVDRVEKISHELTTRGRALARRLNDDVARGTVSDEDLAALNVLRAEYQMLRDIYRGKPVKTTQFLDDIASTNWGDEASKVGGVKKSTALNGGREGSEELARLIDDTGGDSTKINQMSDEIARKGGAYKTLLTMRYNFMLMSIRTHMANVAGSFSTGVWEYAFLNTGRLAINNLEHYVRASVPGLPPMDPLERFTLGTWKSEFNGLLSGVREGATLFSEIMKGKEIPDYLGPGKVGMEMGPSKSNFMGLQNLANEMGLRYDVTEVPAGMAAKIGTSPVRLLEAEDSFFKMMYFNGRIANIAERRARGEAVAKGVDFNDRLRFWKNNPDEAMVTEASQHAKKLTFTNDVSLYGNMLGGLAEASSTLQHTHPFFGALVPFVRTPANIIGYALEMGGLRQVAPASWKKTYKALTTGTAMERADATSRITMAAGMWYFTWGLWEEGKITGEGPPSPDVRRTMMAAGWRPNSVKVNNKYYSLQRMEPFGLALNIIGTVRDWEAHNRANGYMGQENSDIMVGGVLSIADMLVDRSWLSAFVDTVNAIGTQDTRGAQHELVGSALSFFIPNMARDFREFADSNSREMEFRGMWDRVTKQLKNAMPGLSSDLPARIEWDGNYWVNDGSPAWNGLIPIRINDATIMDPAAAALVNARIPLTKPSSRVPIDRTTGARIDLMRFDKGQGFVYQKYQIYVGQERKKIVDKIVHSRKWSQLAKDGLVGPNSLGAIMLQKAVSGGNRAGKAKFLTWLRKTSEFTVNDGEKTIQINSLEISKMGQMIKQSLKGEPVTLSDAPYAVIKQPTQPYPEF